MEVFKAILECFTGHDVGRSLRSTGCYMHERRSSADGGGCLAARIVDIMYSSQQADQTLEKELRNVMHTEDWYESLAKGVLDHLIYALKTSKVMGNAMKKAFDRASRAATDFAQRHPVYTAAIITIIAIGVLVLITPWVVEALGFGELGPIEGSFAAAWQSTLPDVEAGSFFSYLQRLGMKWACKQREIEMKQAKSYSWKL